MFGCVTEW